MPSQLSSFHEGEDAMRNMLHVPAGRNPTAPGLPMPYAMRVRQSPLVALGTLDSQGRPWTTIWGGERGFAGPVAQGVLGFNSAVDMRYDPVFEALWTNQGDGGIVRPNDGQGKMMAGLAIDLETRDRVKLAGVMVAGAVVKDGDEGVGDVQAAMVVTESLGNCPKYLNKKDVVRHDPGSALLVSDELPLPREALDLVYKADMIFVSSTNGETMDTNHRGGSPGFVRVVKNEGGQVELVYPEFSGNRLYQTLGNLKVNPLIGIVIPDYDTANVLYLTGRAEILVGKEASSLLARTQLAVKITVSAARFVKAGLPFRGAQGEYSPYNPPLRHLISEKNDPQAVNSARADITATLIDRQVLSPSINTFTFKLASTSGQPLPKWEAGQHVSLDFEPELGFGYAHMRDEDPQSINDDFIRTFTVSSPPGWKDDEFQITARRHGPATGLLWRRNIRAPLDIPVLGFGGETKFRLPVQTGTEKPVYVAGGVGITPILAQARRVLDAGVELSLLWGLRGEDLGLAVDTFDRIPGLAGVTKLFVTGGEGDEEMVRKLKEAGVVMERRRIGQDDVKGYMGEKRKFYLCAGPRLLELLNRWLNGEEVVWEDFGY
ncbi:oxidoreductase [Pochonia chlamydosporia 170]|uniref:Oxidoreductase n=1 Tax=Pochonia chlamydosporia 170 TaxID=1380566 RepID=A0A179G829_METCM|nr:oxidoreductase [Pochonia chlamydosporia 170]OAQ73957.1 oxidoreductase [Pochonia chlamydosporia 170]